MNSILFSFFCFFRRKDNAFIVFFISILLFLLILVGTYSLSAINYMKNEIYTSIHYRTLEVWKNNSDSTLNENSLYAEKNFLTSINNVVNVSNAYSYRNMIYSKKLITNKMEGYVELLSVSNKSLSNLGIKNIDIEKEPNIMVCPKNFYSVSLLDDIKFYSINDKFPISKMIGKQITFDYESDNNEKKYTISLMLKAVYQNSKHFYDENICLVSEKTLDMIASNQNSSDAGFSMYNNFIVEVDNYDNLDTVKKILVDNGYNYDAMASVSKSFFNDIVKNMDKFKYIIYCISVIFVFFIFLKKMKSDYSHYKLLKYLGYEKRKILLLFYLDNFICVAISVFFAIVLSLLFIFLVKIFFNFYPFVFNKWSIIFDFSSVFIFVVLAMIIVLITGFIFLSMTGDEDND